jgi:putative ABC transport system ATP-binding protein
MITLTNICKNYVMSEAVVHALKGVDLQIGNGDFVAIMGASGSGKSTLMNIIGCLDKSISGEYELDGTSIRPLNRNQLADIRNEKIGFVFQGFNLISRTNAIENVELPLLYSRRKQTGTSKSRATEMLKTVGLSDRTHHEPTQLSGGQQQRIAIARALVNNPRIILADEPTGNLDSLTSEEIMRIFQKLNENGITLVLVTHEPDIALYASRRIEMKDGLIIKDASNHSRKGI